VAHHIAWDYQSKVVLYKELAALYQAFYEGRPSPLAELPIQYADFAFWQRQYVQGETLDKLSGYWKSKLAGAPPKLELPADHPRPAVQSLRGAKVPFGLPAALLDAARQRSR